MIDLYLKGGFVMHVIFAASTVALAIVLERTWFFWSIRENLEKTYHDLIRGGILPEDVSITGKDYGSVGEVLAEGIAQWGRGEKAVQEAMALPGEMLLHSAQRGLPLLSLIGSLSVMLGLFGTVIGLTEAFQTVATLQGQVSPASLASGIWAAMLTTVFGLAVAMVVLLAHHFFQARLSDLAFQLERYGSMLLLRLPASERPSFALEEPSGKGAFAKEAMAEEAMEEMRCSD